MNHIIITLTGNSNKRLDAQAQSIIKIARESGAVKSGPIPMKGKRIVHIYNVNNITIDRLMSSKTDKKLGYYVEDVSVRQSD
jgi:ribosomal protein S10